MSEYQEKEQNLKSNPSFTKSPTFTLKDAVNLGEYDPEYLSNFPEWYTLSVHIRWTLIRKALDIRRKQLLTHWAELNNTLELSKKPHVQQAMKNIEKQLQKLTEDQERLYVEYSNKF
ncbi:MAG: hypothetical protein N2593_02315 [Patescibacteria group bacterium]|nr:hypothetical protein [Patescibacteria group bacterium]